MKSRRQMSVPDGFAGRLDQALRNAAEMSWGDARRWIRSGKVQVDGVTVTAEDRRVSAGTQITVDDNAPREASGLSSRSVVFVDAHVVVVRKPAGMSTVPYDEGERDTLDALVARLVHRGKGPAPTLGVVQRLDKETSGLLVFARSMGAKRGLASQLRAHTMHRRYLVIAHGSLTGRTITSHITANRGDGLRGSTRMTNIGQVAITHVESIEKLAGSTLVGCRLETGRTHQIRIHLAENGNPVVGDRVYIRHYKQPVIPAPRLMLHATELGFVHPITGEEMRFEEPAPADFEQVLQALRR